MRKNNITHDGNHTIIPLQKCIAKTVMDSDGNVLPGRTVFNHCHIVGTVALGLIRRFPDQLASQLFPAGAALVAASHDIGKVSPCFQEKLRRAVYPAYQTLQALPQINPDLERAWGGHAGVSQLTARKIETPQYVAEILGQHHGFSPPVEGKRADDECFGGKSWQQQREVLVEDLKEALQCDWPSDLSVSQARLLAGLTSVADWIGSGEYFENPDDSWEDRVDKALDRAGFIPPVCKKNLSFKSIFGFDPYPAQQQLIDQVQSEGIYVLEAPMGQGKTEAALYAAYQILKRGGATGIYFALPTQLTSNKLFERFKIFLEKILENDKQATALLLHGAAWLQETEMGEEGRPGGSWFNQAKRGLLAPFAVGTLDQALMAAMNVKHGFVRAFGLAGKVVILDEIHTYDAYTGTLLDALVKLLRDLHCTVILLSATLNHDRRQTLLETPGLASHAYPLITAIPINQAPKEFQVDADAHHPVDISQHNQENTAIQEAIERACQGQQVLWIENTVTDAQRVYQILAARSGESGLLCGLLHSRFTHDDRASIETDWVNRFGKAGWPNRLQQGRILVGTQVLEQSLDIDADFLITRFAPTDFLLQRLGRLWRHADTPRCKNAHREVWLLAPDLNEAIATPLAAFGKTARVYNPYVLCRSLEVWKDRKSIELPRHIRSLIDQTYAERSEVDHMAHWLHELDHGNQFRTGRIAMQQLARVALSEEGKTLPESRAQTRYSDLETHDVLLLRGLDYVPEKKASRLQLLNGSQLFLPGQRHRLSKKEWRKLSTQLTRQTVTVNLMDAPSSLPLARLEKLGLQHCFYLGDREYDEATLRVVLVNDVGELRGIDGAPVHEKYTLSYRPDLGYRILKP